MKKIYCFYLLLTLPCFLFAQGKITQKLDEIWNPDAGKWDFQQVDNWTFDQEGREIFFSHEDVFLNDFVLEDKRSMQKKYDDNGNLIFSIQLSYSDTTWREYRSEYQYDDQNRLIENINRQTNSYDPDYLFMNRFVYQYNDLENITIEKEYAFYVGSAEWQLNGEIKTILNDNDCLIEQEETRYRSTGEIYSKQKTALTVDENCRTLTRVFSRQSQNDTELKLRDKDIYTYDNNGENTMHISQRYNESTNNWDTDLIVTSEFDDDKRPIRRLTEYIFGEHSNQTLHLWTYNEQGEQVTFHRYQTYDGLGIETLLLANRDSSIYTYNEAEQLIYKKQFNEYYYYQIEPPTINKFQYSTKYAYYCDGQLKSTTTENLPNIYRTTYEYDEGGDCHLDNQDLEITIFPNPSNGSMEIRSNLLASPNVELRVFSVLGQEVLHQKLTNVSERFSLDLTNVPNGNYVISIIQGKTIISNKVYILK